jgi:hypothetical protein
MMRRTLAFAMLLAAATAMAQEQASEPVPPPPLPRESRFTTIDRLELETTSITGNRELPKVMYIVPWKKADLGDLSGKPARSLIDEVLAPVDRDVFRREVGYYEALAASQAKP